MNAWLIVTLGWRTVLMAFGSIVATGADPSPGLLPPPSAREGGGQEKPGVRSPLQVRLEVDVVANLAVNLQTIPLAVGDDYAVGFRIEVHRRREAEAKFRLQALCPTSGFHHIGVGVDALLAPLGHDLSIADESCKRASFRVEDANPMVPPIGDIDIAIGIHGDVGRMIQQGCLRIARRARGRQVRSHVGDGIGTLRHRNRPVLADLHQELALGRQFLDAVILPVRDVDIARLVEGDPPRLVELAISAPALAAFGHELSVGGEDLEAIVPAIDHDDVAVFLAHQTGRAYELAITTARLSPLPEKLAVTIEHGDGVVPFIRGVHLALAVDSDAERPGRASVSFARLEKLADKFFLAGSTAPHA